MSRPWPVECGLGPLFFDITFILCLSVCLSVVAKLQVSVAFCKSFSSPGPEYGWFLQFVYHAV